MNLPEVRRLLQGLDNATFDLAIPPTLDAFNGHFPGEPILPGVLQIDWALQFAGQMFGIDQPAAREFQVKFSRAVHPDDMLSLCLRIDRRRGSVVFEYRVAEETVSSGKIKLDPLG
jgi:3-hydroxymyristoyl/3-hydroxydecanoyl-(acyl carrier protein) dehydratase